MKNSKSNDSFIKEWLQGHLKISNICVALHGVSICARFKALQGGSKNTPPKTPPQKKKTVNVGILVADTRLSTQPCRSVRPSVHPFVRHISKLRLVFALLLLPNRPRLSCRVPGLFFFQLCLKKAMDQKKKNCDFLFYVTFYFMQLPSYKILQATMNSFIG